MGEDAVKANVIKVVEKASKKLEEPASSHGPEVTTGKNKKPEVLSAKPTEKADVTATH